MTALISSEQLNWRTAGHGFSLHLERRASALLHVVPDSTCGGMWRLRLVDGSLSDMANLTRVKDAGLAHALATLNRQLRHQETPQEGRTRVLAAGTSIRASRTTNGAAQ